MNLSITYLRIFPSVLRYGIQVRVPTVCSVMQHREAHTKHWKPEFKKLRRLKVQKIKLPDFNEVDSTKMTPDEIRARLKENGVLPTRPWQENPVYIGSTGGIFEAYVPPEGDGKLSAISIGGAKQSMEMVTKKSKSLMAVRKIRSFDEDFDPKIFAQTAQDIYVKAHKALAEKDYDTLHSCVTELSFTVMTEDLRYCTLRWQFIKSLEPPRVVHVRCTDVINKENVFAQVTVRFHTQQTLAVYDRFGRLFFGSEVLSKDVLEYVVFEKHIANQYGVWRIHEKIIPDWMPPREPSVKTFILKKSPPDSEVTSPSSTSTAVPTNTADQPLATA